MSDQELRLELRRFLKDRRARIDPTDVGIPRTARRRVRGLRREEVAALAGIGVSWYTALESGDAKGVSPETLSSVADALRLSASERTYLFTLTGLTPVDDLDEPAPLLIEALHAVAFPAYIITASWEVLRWNAAFSRVWGIDDDRPFNAVERLFLDRRARPMHGDDFIANIAPVVAMVRSAIGRRPHLATLQRLRTQLVADDTTRALWDAYEISDPLVSTTCTIASPIGSFRYETLTLANPGSTSGIVIQIPDPPSRLQLERSLAADAPALLPTASAHHARDRAP